jgi:hypothetical protein
MSYESLSRFDIQLDLDVEMSPIPFHFLGSDTSYMQYSTLSVCPEEHGKINPALLAHKATFFTEGGAFTRPYSFDRSSGRG